MVVYAFITGNLKPEFTIDNVVELTSNVHKVHTHLGPRGEGRGRVCLGQRALAVKPGLNGDKLRINQFGPFPCISSPLRV